MLLNVSSIVRHSLPIPLFTYSISVAKQLLSDVGFYFDSMMSTSV